MSLLDQSSEYRIAFVESVIENSLKGGLGIGEAIDLYIILFNYIKEDCDAAWAESQVMEIHERLLESGGYRGSTRRNIQQEIEDLLYFRGAGDVNLTDIYTDLKLSTREEKTACRVALNRLAAMRKIIKVNSGKTGVYRLKDDSCETLDFINADTVPFNVRWPLSIHEYVDIYKKSLVVIAGEPNAGKTAYLLNVAKLNRSDHEINYFSSEMGAAELRIRLDKFNLPLELWKTVNFKSRSAQFKDVINPNGFNIIDYLEVSKDFFEIGGLLTEIYNTLNTGIAVVAIQKPRGRESGVGGERTLDKARLYLSIEPGKLKIIKGKLWRNNNVNPNGLWVKFKLINGADFKNETPWSRD